MQPSKFTGYGLLLLFLSGLFACSAPEPIRLQGSTMGTSYSVVIPKLGKQQNSKTLSKAAIQQGIESLLKQVNQQMSTYLADSELSRFNQSAAQTWLSLSPELFQTIQAAQLISEQSAGAFDITVGPLVNLWGFGPDIKPDLKPSAEQLESAKKRVGYQYLEIELQGRRIRKPFKNLYIDLSAIAKGYAVDVVASYLDSLHIPSYLIEIGGELKAKGLSQRGDHWRVALEKPLPGQRMVQKVISVTDFAVATSGDYRNYFEQDGVRFSHTIDPRTGSSISHALASVTVLSEQAMLADAWATALMVLGESKGYQLAEEQGLAAYFIYRQGDEFLSRETSAFTRLTEHSG